MILAIVGSTEIGCYETLEALKLGVKRATRAAKPAAETLLAEYQGRISQAIAIIADVLTRYKPSKVVSGGAPGIDTLAENVAKARGIEFEAFLPKVKNWELGFKPRNIKIAEACDGLVRIASRTSKTYGSGWTRDYAAKLGKHTEEFVL